MDYELPIKNCLESKIFLTYSSLAAYKEYEVLLKENFMNIAIYGEDVYTVVFTDNVDYNCALLSQCISDYRTYNQNDITFKEDLCNILSDNLLNGYYCQIWANEFYIKASTFFSIHHYIHPLLVYGIHEVNGDFHTNAVVFNQDRGVILCQITLDLLFEAIKSCAELHLESDPLQESVYRTIKAFTFKKAVDLPFDLDTFRMNFESYLFSKPIGIKERSLHIDWSQVKYGLHVNDVIIDILENIDKKHISFTSFCHFLVCKQSILDRLKYVDKLFPLSLQRDIELYQEVCRAIESIKMKSIKLNYLNKEQINSLNRDPLFISDAIETLRTQNEKERSILLSVHKKICQYLNNTSRASIDTSCYSISGNSVSVDLGEEHYVYEIFIIFNGRPVIKPIGIFKIDGFEYLTDKNSVKLLEISDTLTKKKISRFEYILQNADSCNICDLRFAVTVDLLPISPANRTEFFVDGITDTSEKSYGMKIVDNDPFIAVRNLNIPDFLRYIYIRCNIKSTSNTAQLIFVTEDENYLSITKSKFITVQNDGSNNIYKIDMSGNEHWHGIIKGIRFDPAHNDNTDFQGEFIMDYIKFTEILPEYSSDKDFCKTQGVNSWFYYTTDSGIAYREMKWDECEKAYVGINDNILRVDREIQTARGHFSTVRRWICPSDGEYHILCSFNEIGDGKELRVRIKCNHVEEVTFLKNDTKHFSGTYDKILPLSYGESMSFEFYSSDYPQPAELEMTVTIQKKSLL